MTITFRDDGTIFNVSFNPTDTEQLVQLDLVDHEGKVKARALFILVYYAY